MLNSSRLSLRVRDSKSGSCSQHSLGARPSQSLLPPLTCPGMQGRKMGNSIPCTTWEQDSVTVSHCRGEGTTHQGRKVTQTQGCSGLGKQFHILTINFSRGETQTFQDAVQHLLGEAQLECCNGVSPCPTPVALSCYSSFSRGDLSLPGN